MKRLLPAFCLILAACAGPVTLAPQGSSLEIRQETEREKEIAYKRIVEDQDLVFNIAFPILAANAEFCGDRTAPSFGMTAWNLETVRQDYHQAAQALYNLHGRLAVQHVAPKSPAARAGIHSGDFIVAINGEEIPHDRNARRTADEALRDGGYNPADILLERSDRMIHAVVQPVETCNYPVMLDSESNDINAFTDGRRIVISKGTLRFAENSNEVALVIAHELGHLAMRHVDKQRQNALVGAIGGLALDSLLASAGVNTGSEMRQLGQDLGAQRFSVAFEQEADYVGMYFMERAGYNSSHVAGFWRRAAAEMPKSVSMSADHPATPERFIAIERTHKEIAAKKSRGQKLVPNFR
jgi:membrane-associated protease RseP (regulator of RpoE activity)